jgi:hypothetical protein
MFRRFVLAALLTASAGAWAQYQPGSTSQPQTNSPSVVVVPSSPSVYVVGGGLYGTGVYLVNPGTLPTQETGISLAGRQGISLATPLQTGAFTGAPTLIGGSMVNSEIGYSNAPPWSTYGTVAAAESGRQINDMGPSYYAGASVVAAASEPSLGEVAARYRAHHPRAVRTFTNADVERLTNTVTIPGATTQHNKPPENPPPH